MATSFFSWGRWSCREAKSLRKVADEKSFSGQAASVLLCLDRLWTPNPFLAYDVVPTLDTIFRVRKGRCILGYRYLDHRFWQARALERAAVSSWQSRLPTPTTKPTPLFEFQVELAAILIMASVYGPEYCAAVLEMIPHYQAGSILNAPPHVVGKLLVVAWLTGEEGGFPCRVGNLESIVQTVGSSEIPSKDYFELVARTQIAFDAVFEEWKSLSLC